MKNQKPYWWGTFWSWTLASVVSGSVGAGISNYLGAPGYFGGTIGFVLIGMTGLFALAARIARRH
jgi:hypothetical protein